MFRTWKQCESLAMSSELHIHTFACMMRLGSMTVSMVLIADAVHPLHEDAVCRHQHPPHDRAGVPPCVHASVPACQRGGSRCPCCGCNRAAAGLQGGLCCGPLLWHLCGLQTVSAASFLGAVPGEPPCLSSHTHCPSIAHSLLFNFTLFAFHLILIALPLRTQCPSTLIASQFTLIASHQIPEQYPLPMLLPLITQLAVSDSLTSLVYS